MKKYITVAALFAASTAFANAASLVAQWNDFSDLTSDLGSKSLSVGLGTSGAEISGNALSVKSVSTSAARASVDLSSAGITGAGFTLVMTFTGFSNGTNQVIADMVYDGSCNQGGETGYGFGRGNNTNAYWRLNRQGTVKTDDTTYTDVASDTSEHTAVMTFDATGNVCLYIDSSNCQTAAVSSSNVSDSTSFTKLVLGGFGAHNNAACSFTLEKMALYDGVLDTEKITNGEVYAAIPEPSAFGLLAGAGALALVAARRRRRAK